jgi:hypothetical protein
MVVALPSSPSGRSLKEGLASMKAASLVAEAAPSVVEFITIPDDIVLCLELEIESLPSVAAALIAEQPWLAELAPRLVSRKDVPWDQPGSFVQGAAAKTGERSSSEPGRP